MSEAKLKKAVLEALRAAGITCWGNAIDNRNNLNTGLGRGSSDIICAVRMKIPLSFDLNEPSIYHISRFTAIELKLPGSRPKPHEKRQKEFRALVNNCGGYAVVSRSVKESFLAVVNSSLGKDARDWKESE